MKQYWLDEYFLLGKHRFYKIVVISSVILSIVRAYLSRWPDENFIILNGINAIIVTVITNMDTNTTTMIPWITTGSLRKALLTVENRFGSVLSRRVALGIVCLGSRTRYPVAKKKKHVELLYSGYACSRGHGFERRRIRERRKERSKRASGFES